MHILHTHVSTHVPEETIVKIDLLPTFFFHFCDRILDKSNFEKEGLILALSLRIQSLVRIQRRGRSIGSWWPSFTVRNQRDGGWGYLTYPFFHFLFNLESQAMERSWLNQSGSLHTEDSNAVLNPARQHAERRGSAFTPNAWMLYSIEKPLSVPAGSLPGLGCVW